MEGERQISRSFLIDKVLIMTNNSLMVNATTAAADTNAVISARILARVAAGDTVEKAVNAVLGAGAYEKLVDELYDELKGGR